MSDAPGGQGWVDVPCAGGCGRWISTPPGIARSQEVRCSECTPPHDPRAGRAEGLAWEAVHADGDAVLPQGWSELTAAERDFFRAELEEWMAKANAQPQLFADRGARARRLLELTEER